MASLILTPLTTVDSAKAYSLGTRGQDHQGNEYIYLQGVASTAVGDLVHFDESFLTTRTTASSVGPIAVALAATVANKFGWYIVSGMATVNTGAAVSADKQLYLHATAGSCDDATVNGDLIYGAISQTAATGAATVTAWINNPFTTAVVVET